MKMDRLLVVQPWGIGDVLMTIPMINAIRLKFPDAQIDCLVRGRPQLDLLHRSGLCDTIEVMPTKESAIWKTLTFFRRLRKRQYQSAFLATRVSPFLATALRFFSQIPIVVGDSGMPFIGFTHRLSIDRSKHRVDAMLDIAAQIIGPSTPQIAHLVTSDAEQAEVAELLSKHGITINSYLVVHPGSSRQHGTDKRLPTSLVEEISADLAGRHAGLKVIVILGPDDGELDREYAHNGPHLIIAKSLTLGATIALIRNAVAFAGSDSALGHIASAVGTPSITISGPTIPNQTRPYGPHTKVLTTELNLSCQPCWGTPLYGKCPHGLPCMKNINSALATQFLSHYIIQRKNSREA